MENKEWDSPLVEEEREDFKILPKGEYRFVMRNKQIIPVESKGEKTLGAPMAKLELYLYAVEDEKYEKMIGIGFDNLIRHPSTDWKACQFFIAIGERKHGDNTPPPWDMIPGACGRAIFYPDSYNGRESMKVESYIDPTKTPLPESKAPEPKPDDNIPF